MVLGLALKIPACDAGSALPPSFPASDSCVHFREVTPLRGAFSFHVTHQPCDHGPHSARRACGQCELSVVTEGDGHRVSR